jgi:hypothetical protein
MDQDGVFFGHVSIFHPIFNQGVGHCVPGTHITIYIFLIWVPARAKVLLNESLPLTLSLKECFFIIPIRIISNESKGIFEEEGSRGGLTLGKKTDLLVTHRTIIEGCPAEVETKQNKSGFASYMASMRRLGNNVLTMWLQGEWFFPTGGAIC